MADPRLEGWLLELGAALLCALLAEPFALGSGRQIDTNALKMKPFNRALWIVAGYHLPIRDALAIAVDRLSWISSCRNAAVWLQSRRPRTCSKVPCSVTTRQHTKESYWRRQCQLNYLLLQYFLQLK